MLKQIAEELCRAGRRVSMEKLLEMAPIYLCFLKNGNEENMIFAVEQLLMQLEEQRLFSAQTDEVICLHIEYGFC